MPSFSDLPGMKVFCFAAAVLRSSSSLFLFLVIGKRQRMIRKPTPPALHSRAGLSSINHPLPDPSSKGGGEKLRKN
jgi:hypothetical protein